MAASQTLGSQRLLQIAVEKRPELLLRALRRSGAIGRREDLTWASPVANAEYTEYRDLAALRQVGIESLPKTPLKDFWPNRGQVWDGLGNSSSGRPVLVEAKAHIPEMVSGPSAATAEASVELIRRSLSATRKHLAPRSRVDWNGPFYQYANRLAFQFFLRRLNGIDSSLVFLYFTNAVDMAGPATEAEWHGAIRLVHACLGLPGDLSEFGVFKAFVDARRLTDQE
jgi:hypothetical protein